MIQEGGKYSFGAKLHETQQNFTDCHASQQQNSVEKFKSVVKTVHAKLHENWQNLLRLFMHTSGKNQ